MQPQAHTHKHIQAETADTQLQGHTQWHAYTMTVTYNHRHTQNHMHNHRHTQLREHTKLDVHTNICTHKTAWTYNHRHLHCTHTWSAHTLHKYLLFNLHRHKGLQVLGYKNAFVRKPFKFEHSTEQRESQAVTAPLGVRGLWTGKLGLLFSQLLCSSVWNHQQYMWPHTHLTVITFQSARFDLG